MCTLQEVSLNHLMYWYNVDTRTKLGTRQISLTFVNARFEYDEVKKKLFE